MVERVRQVIEVSNRRDFDAMMSVFAPDAVWDASLSGVGTFEGSAAIRSFAEDWIGTYDEYENQLEEVQNLGNGVVFGVGRLDARPVGTSGRVQERGAYTVTFSAGMIVRVIARNDIDEARAAAERVAEERG